jgi:tRNA (cytidine/uridine-2'-O-)-methyltransferase
LGFSTDDRYLKRAGLDYWHLVKVHYHDNFSEVEAALAGHNFYFNTTKAEQFYSEIQYGSSDVLVFGKETAGLPEDLLAANKERCVRIPMFTGARSLNLSNAVAVVIYEALRQQRFSGLG